MGDYLRRGWDVVTRHKKKVVALGLVGASVGGYYYVKSFLRSSLEQFALASKQMGQRLSAMNYRTNEAKRIRGEGASIIGTFVPPLRRRLYTLTDPRPVTMRIKDHRKQRATNVLAEAATQTSATSSVPDIAGDQLWEELKTLSLTRLVASVYALGLLHVLVRLQLHVLGRYAMQETLEIAASELEGDEQEKQPTAERNSPAVPRLAIITAQVREAFLFFMSDHLISGGDGMEVLVNHVYNNVMHTTKPWLMGNRATVTRTEVLDMLVSVRCSTEESERTCTAKAELKRMAKLPHSVAEEEASQEGQDDIVPNLSGPSQAWLVRCLIDSGVIGRVNRYKNGEENNKQEEEEEEEQEEKKFAPVASLTKEQNTILESMLNETMDLVESPMFAAALDSTLDHLFMLLIKHIQTASFGPKAAATTTSAETTTAATAAVTTEKKQSGGVLEVTANGVQEEEDEEEDEDSYMLAKVVVSLKQMSSDVLASPSTSVTADAAITPPLWNDETGSRKFVDVDVHSLPAVDEMCALVLGADDDEDDDMQDEGAAMSGAIGGLLGGLIPGLGGVGGPGGDDLSGMLGDLNLSQDEMSSLTQLLSGGGPGGEGGPMGGDGGDEQLAKLFGSLMQMEEGGGAAGGNSPLAGGGAGGGGGDAGGLMALMSALAGGSGSGPAGGAIGGIEEPAA